MHWAFCWCAYHRHQIVVFVEISLERFNSNIDKRINVYPDAFNAISLFCDRLLYIRDCLGKHSKYTPSLYTHKLMLLGLNAKHLWANFPLIWKSMSKYPYLQLSVVKWIRYILSLATNQWINQSMWKFIIKILPHFCAHVWQLLMSLNSRIKLNQNIWTENII